MKPDYFLTLAKKASKKSDHHQYHMGCVIARGSKVLGVGYNVMKTHPSSPHEYKSIHAEFMAFINAGRDVRGATAYIFRQQRNGVMAMAKPCESCWKFLMDQGVKKVVYSFEGSFRQEKLT